MSFLWVSRDLAVPINDLNLALINYKALHPYFKLQYIQRAWGGAEEQAEERAAGNKDAKNWYDEALKVLEDTVLSQFIIIVPFNDTV